MTLGIGCELASVVLQDAVFTKNLLKSLTYKLRHQVHVVVIIEIITYTHILYFEPIRPVEFNQIPLKTKRLS